ncbi:NADH:ubiquinone oxidoreductase [Roseovarius sp. 2305UL8-3]|uniref:NADH:ubiquinone oxidoreductase n=1 Tax=Roseovarius conchicola TaxID=3121636 RepID=UPI003526D7B8
MTPTGGWNTCSIFWWTVGGVAGIVAYVMAHQATTALAALMLGAALAVFIGLAMTRLFCTGIARNLDAEDRAAPSADTASIASEAAKTAPKMVESETPEAFVAPTPVANAETSTPDYDGDGVVEGENEGTRPEALSAARDGKADNLKEIKGIGPKLEKLCNAMGFYHFDQIAAWTDDEVAWVNANLEGFKGRVSRDNWVEQAKILAAGGETEFSKRVEDGDVY